MFKSITVSKVSKLTARVSRTVVTLKYDRNMLRVINSESNGTYELFLHYIELFRL